MALACLGVPYSETRTLARIFLITPGLRQEEFPRGRDAGKRTTAGAFGSRGFQGSKGAITIASSNTVDAKIKACGRAMSMMLHPPVAWRNQPLRLYHGTTDAHAETVMRSGVQIGSRRSRRDFGPGFYTTTLREQAEHWAWQVSSESAGTQPAVLELTLDRDSLGLLETLAFVRGEREAEDFWSLVAHCRSGATDHGRRGPNSYYDVVVGPVAAFWQQRVSMLGADQISFHTERAQRLLNSAGTERRRVW